MNKEIEKYAKLLSNMATDYLLGKIETNHYCDTVNEVAEQMAKVKKGIDPYLWKCGSCNTFKMCKKDGECYIEFKRKE